MKKMKLLSFVLSGILAVSSMCGITASASDLFEIPESITSIKELEDYITEPVEISAEDYIKLFNHMTEEELEEFFKSNGVSESDADLNVKTYYEGMKELAESDCTFVIFPGGIETDYVPNLPQTPLGAPVFETLTETSGTFESGVTYFYNEETKGLIFDGNGELSTEDFSRAFASFEIGFVFYGNDVTFECCYGKIFNAFSWTLVQDWYNVVDMPVFPTYTYEDSEFTRQFDECAEEIGANEDGYKYYTVEDGTDPYTFVNPLPKPPTHITDGGMLWDMDRVYTTPAWFYEGTVYDGVSKGLLVIITAYDEPYTLEDVLKVVGDYAVTEVCLGETDMSVLPAELQNCETIEEAEAELLRLINEAKEDEQPIEETTEATVPTEVTETTEAVEEKTAETIVESVEIFADEIAEDKTEITLGDVNGNGKADVRDVSFIAREIAGGKAADLPDSADYNKDGVKNIRDAATLAKELA